MDEEHIVGDHSEAVENENGVQHHGSGRKKYDTMTLIPTLMVSKSPVSMAEIKNFHVRIFLSKI
ncbi:unnamed protein product [Acanthoscelides obtectus]|uniref:Uncharacterized protein n=1 Tax=Acanthoscelides obtectus TaxID=200917 RepID=A0A9P0NWN8_ACAOB|nr:unnamed protein product [Acanthoscelides obtectus]CAK1642911.1 hypothetical protein AOBTE_LOCUS13287 [Acanthoscelides obtectus]